MGEDEKARVGTVRGWDTRSRPELSSVMFPRRPSPPGVTELERIATVHEPFRTLVQHRQSGESALKDHPHIRRLAFLASNLQKTADGASALRRYEELLENTGMAPLSLGDQLGNVARVVRQRLDKLLMENRSMPVQGALSPRPMVLEILRDLLSASHALALTNMLRLQQALEAYFKDSPDEAASRLYEDAGCFREACAAALGDLQLLGICFHPIRFLEPIDSHCLNIHDKTESLPYLHRNKRLLESIRRRIISAANCWDTVADVDQWGLECVLDPKLNRQTHVWCWRAGALQAAEIG